MLMAGATLALDAGLLRGRELWWMVLVGLGSYLAYVPFGTALFERLLASTHFRGNAVFAIYIADSVGYTGSISSRTSSRTDRSLRSDDVRLDIDGWCHAYA